MKTKFKLKIEDFSEKLLIFKIVKNIHITLLITCSLKHIDEFIVCLTYELNCFI